MESLTETDWDVVLSNTGLSQSLLALALSRSGKQVLHLDPNDYYGGAEAALSLQEAEAWAKAVDDGSRMGPFRNATISKPDHDGSKLGFSRAYSLSLSPQLIYTRSNLLPALVSSQVYRQLEFLAIGSWWIYEPEADSTNGKEGQDGSKSEKGQSTGCLRRIPGSREDVFADKSLDLRSTRSLMKLLKLAADSESHAGILEQWGEKPFHDFLSSHLNIPPKLQSALLALTLTPDTPAQTTTNFALPCIHRHLTSIGIFGPGFGSVIPKWGGLAEIAQVACRAGAVGGGVYVLDKGIKKVSGDATALHHADEEVESQVSLQLETDEAIKTRWLVSSHADFPSPRQQKSQDVMTNRSITIISSTLPQLFPSFGEGAPPPAGAVVVFPTGCLSIGSQMPPNDCPPVYLMIHSSETGECPIGQCVIYAHTTPSSIASPSSSNTCSTLLTEAIDTFIHTINEDPKPEVLWSMHYTQQSPSTKPNPMRGHRHIQISEMLPTLVLEDEVLREVRDAWEKIVGNAEGDGEDEAEGHISGEIAVERSSFLQFKERSTETAPGDGDETGL